MATERMLCVNCVHDVLYDQLDICELFKALDSMIGAEVIDDPTAWFCAGFEDNGEDNDWRLE